MTTVLGKIRLLRTTSTAIAATTLEEGRLAYLTDENSLISGDGSTVGASLPRIGNLFLDPDPTLSTNLDLNGFRITTISGSGIAIGSTIARGDSSTAIRGAAYTDYTVSVGVGCKSYGEGSTSLGFSTTASGLYSVSIGSSNRTDGDYSLATGAYARSNRFGMRAHSGTSFGLIAGSIQQVDFVLGKVTTNATLTTLMLDNSTSRLLIDNGKAIFGTATIAGIKSDGSLAAMYMRKFAIKNIGGTTSLIGSIETIGTDIEDDADWGIQITADDTNNALDIAVSGEASTTIRWGAHVQGVELAYGT